MRQYRPFVIEIDKEIDGGYPVIARFEGGSWRGVIPADLPLLSEQEVGQALRWLERGVIDWGYAREFGDRLFRTLLPDPIRVAFKTAYERAAPEDGLRLVLICPPELTDLPWELVYDREGGHGFLARSAAVTLVRYFTDLPLPHQPPGEGPLRVLVMTAAPKGYAPLSSAREMAELGRTLAKRRISLWHSLRLVGQHLFALGSLHGLSERLRRRSLFEVEHLPHATRQRLKERMVQARSAGQGYHVIHFIGHGEADEQGTRLLLETEDERVDFISAAEFADLVDEPTVNLAMLNACRTAAPVTLFSSVSQALLKSGVSAVIGMQTPVLDRVARELALEFYGAWARGRPIEGALADARSLVAQADSGAAADWSIPVLHMGPIEGLSLQMEFPPLKWVNRTIALVIFLIFTLIPTAYFYRDLLPQGPVRMDKTFNIAVVEFGEQAGSGLPVRTSRDGTWISQDRIYEGLAPLEGNEELRGLFQVQYIDTPIRGATVEEREKAVQELARELNATIVIYGTLNIKEPPYHLTPEFYVSDQFSEGEELTGGHAFGQAIPYTWPLDDLERLDLAEKLEPRIEALNFFNLGLAYFLIDRPDKALTFLDRAGEIEASWQNEQGKEVLYLFQGSSLIKQAGLLEDPARIRTALQQAELKYRQALTATNHQYARAYLGLGKLHLDRATSGGVIDFQLIDAAIDDYQQALAAGIRPAGAYVDIKTYFNLGLAYAWKARFLDTSCPDEEAIDYLQEAVRAYRADRDVPLVQELGFRTYYQLGLLYENCGDQRWLEELSAEAAPLFRQAGDYFQCSILIATPQPVEQPGWLSLPWGAPPARLQELPWQQERWLAYAEWGYTAYARGELADPALFEQAAAIYQRIAEQIEKNEGDISPDLAARVYFNLGLTMERLGAGAGAREAYLRVLDVAPESSPDRSKAKERVDVVSNSLNGRQNEEAKRKFNDLSIDCPDFSAAGQ